MFKRAILAGAMLPATMLTACVVVGMTNYTVPVGAPTATLAFQLAPSDAARVGQQIIFLDDEVTMTMPAIYGMQNGDAAGPERMGDQFSDRPELVEAGRRLFIFARTTLPDALLNNPYCRSQASFVPEAGHSYDMRHMTTETHCALVIRDRATGEDPPDLQRHDADRVILPI